MAGDYGRQYRAVFTNDVAAATTRAATLTVRDPGIAGDIDGDRQPDLLWRSQASGANAMWDLGGIAHVATEWLPAQPDLNWALAGTADVDGDGQADLVWRNLATGANEVWYMDGETRAGIDALDAEPDLNWLLVGTGDINDDGKPDLVWRHRVSGAMRVWYMDGPARLGIGHRNVGGRRGPGVGGGGDR